MLSIKNATPDICIGLLPAAGKGERLGVPFPKELFPIIDKDHYKPVSAFSIENLVTANISNIVFVINETKQELIKYFGNGNRLNCQITYVVQEKWQNDTSSKSPGLAHALDSAYHQIRNKLVFFCMPDTIVFPKDVFIRAKDAAPEDADLILCLFPTDTPEKYGMVELHEFNRVKKIIDKPTLTELNYMWGCIIWSPKFSDYLHNQVISASMGDFAEILNNAIIDGMNFYGLQLDKGRYFDIGTPNEVLEVYQHLH